MNPFPPGLSIRPLTLADSKQIAALVGNYIATIPYCSQIDAATVQQEILTDAHPGIFPCRWQHHRHLGVWRAGALIGMLNAAVGMDKDSLDQPDYQPLGLIRFMVLPTRAELIQPVATLLFEGVQEFWQETGVGYVKAFHISTGYPSFQAGAGILPGDWADHVRVLTGDGFHLIDRYYCLFRNLDKPLEEAVPLSQLSLVQRGKPQDRIYELYHRRIDFVGSARLVQGAIRGPSAAMQISYLTDIHIDSPWQRQNIGRWLLRRLINDATLQGNDQIVTHLAHRHHAAMNLLIQHGFQELSYRGYTLEKGLTA